jgi:hypothetical protein
MEINQLMRQVQNSPESEQFAQPKYAAGIAIPTAVTQCRNNSHWHICECAIACRKRLDRGRAVNFAALSKDATYLHVCFQFGETERFYV